MDKPTTPSTTFERRQRILALLGERENVSVKELVAWLEVSEGTIRNDLNALEEEGRLVRVRGGATLPRVNGAGQSAPVAARVRLNATAKQWIARRAATMVEDGDVIVLDASTTVYHMVPYLQTKRNLTIFTNGLELGRVLATNPANSVVLIGGALRPDGASTGGSLGAHFLEGLHFKCAFVSCVGLTLATGLSERHIAEAEVKAQMIAASSQVVALVDSTKFGVDALAPFAALDDIAHILTDRDLDPIYIETFSRSRTTLTLCGETTTASYMPSDRNKKHYRIGFGNLAEYIPFAVDVRRGLEEAASAAGNIDLIVADNRLDSQIALHVAERMLARDVDLFIEYQLDEKVGNVIMNKFQQAGIPVIAVDIPMVGAIFFGADNYQTGRTAGVALGEWIAAHWQGQVDYLVVLEELRAGALPAARIQGQLDGVQAIIGEVSAARVIRVLGGSMTEKAQAKVDEVLRQRPDAHRIGVLSFNDDVALGALYAARKLGREGDVAIVGQGADRQARIEIRQPHSRFIGSTTFMPEKYGARLIELAQQILSGEPVPPANYIDHFFVTADNIELFYRD